MGMYIVAGVIVLGLLLAGGLYFGSHRSAKLTEQDSILLTDFVNTTGDAVFDITLKQALGTQLEQSPYLHILPESRIREALKLMGRPEDQRITGDIGREICLRENAKAMLTGSIASLGSHYVISISAINAQTQDSLATEQASFACIRLSFPTERNSLTCVRLSLATERESFGTERHAQGREIVQLGAGSPSLRKCRKT